MNRKHAYFVMLNEGRGSREVVAGQMEAFEERGFTVSHISTKPYTDLGVHTVQVDIDGLPVPIHDFLPQADRPTVPVYALNATDANVYKDLFIDGIHRAIDEAAVPNEQSIMVVPHANIHTAAAHEVSQSTGIPFIVQPHGTCIGGYQKSGKIDAYHRGDPAGETWRQINDALDGASSVVAISDYIRTTQIAPYVRDLDRIRTIYNPVNFNALKDADDDFIRQLMAEGKLKDMPYILQIGILTEWKRPHELAQATHLLPDDVQTIFIGKAEGDMGERVMREGKNTLYLGPQYGQKRNALLQGARVLAVSSLEEPFGLTPIEGNAVGIPAVVRPGGAMPELITDGRNGFIAKDTSIPAYAEALYRGLTQETSLTGRELSAYARQEFGPENTTHKMVDLAEGMLQDETTREQTHELRQEPDQSTDTPWFYRR
jgi:glycosyltransferase involved in cell wall biosynthesis